MILIHRLKGEPVYFNSDLIESVESTPDTVLTLVDGRKMVVAESPEQITAKIRDFRASILAAADNFRSGESADLLMFPGGDDSPDA